MMTNKPTAENISLTIPSGTTKITARAYADNSQITELILPKGLEVIDQEAFWGCKKLKEVELPEGIEYIGKDAFEKGTLLRMTMKNIWDLEMLPYSDAAYPVAICRTDESEQILERIVVCLDSRYRGHNNLAALGMLDRGRLNYKKYDMFMVHGSDDFRLNANAKLRLALYRLRYPTELDEQFRNYYLKLCRDSERKVTAYAIGDHDPEMVKMLYKLGVIKKYRKAVLKMLEASGQEEMLGLVDWAKAFYIPEPDEAIPKMNFEEISGVDDEAVADGHQVLASKYAEKLDNRIGITTLMKMGLLTREIPETVMLRDGQLAPKELLRFIIESYGAQYKKSSFGYRANGPFSFFIDQEADEAAELLDRGSLLRALDFLCKQVNILESPHMIIPYCRYGDGRRIMGMISQVKKWSDVNKYGMAGKCCVDVAIYAMLLNDTCEAMLYFSNKNMLQAYAALRGISEDELWAYRMADIECESEKLRYRVIQRRRELMFPEFMQRKAMRADLWIKLYRDNPLMRGLAQSLVWQQGQDCFVLTEEGTRKHDGSAYEIRPDVDIVLAHPLDIGYCEISAWKKYIASKGIKPPFDQLSEPKTYFGASVPNRYEGCVVPLGAFMKRAGYGIRLRRAHYSGDWYLEMLDCSLKIKAESDSYDRNVKVTLGEFTYEKFTRNVNRIIAYLDRLTVRGRIIKDDPYFEQSLSYCKIEKDEIPGLLELALENQSRHCIPVLLEYKNRWYPELCGAEDLSLDDEW